MPRLYVVDTNVVVSGVLRYGQGSAPAEVLDHMLGGRLPFLLSADLLAEYRLVLLRPAPTARHGLGAGAVDALMAELAVAGYLRQPVGGAGRAEDDPAPAFPAGDGHIVRLLACEPRSALVSGDLRLLEALRGWRTVLTPAEAGADRRSTE